MNDITSLPRISIVTPSYNQGHYIEQTIRSILDQGYPNLELIIMDGGSTDNTVDILQKYNDQITYWVSEPDRGQADALQKGFARVTGEIFNWINSDDYLEPGALHHIGSHFLHHPETQVLCGFTRCFYDDDNSTSHTYQMGVRSSATDTMLNVEMNQPGSFFRTDCVRAVGGINPSLRYIFDNELWFRFLHRFGVSGIRHTDQLIAQFRLHKSSKSVHDGFVLFERESKAIWTWMAKTYKFDAALQTCLLSEEQVASYQSEPWIGNQLHFQQVESHWCFYYLLDLMRGGHFSLARRGWSYGWKKNKLKKQWRKYASAGIKLFLFPGFFKR